jgi:hypothetical protein
MNLELHLQIVGTLMLLLAAAHVVFPKRFQWKEELSRLSPLNRQIFIVHCLFILVVLVQMGLLSLVFTRTLIESTTLAVVVLSGLCMFWVLRLFAQWFVYDRKLWLGNRFNTVVHALFTCLWTYFSVVYGWALYLQFYSSG